MNRCVYHIQTRKLRCIIVLLIYAKRMNGFSSFLQNNSSLFRNFLVKVCFWKTYLNHFKITTHALTISTIVEALMH